MKTTLGVFKFLTKKLQAVLPLWGQFLLNQTVVDINHNK